MREGERQRKTNVLVFLGLIVLEYFIYKIEEKNKMRSRGQNILQAIEKPLAFIASHK
jgi:hypothetical protein